MMKWVVLGVIAYLATVAATLLFIAGATMAAKEQDEQREQDELR